MPVTDKSKPKAKIRMKKITQTLKGIPLVRGIFAVSVSLITVTAPAYAQVFTPTFTNIWVVPAGTYAGMPANTANNCRGVAIDTVTTNVLYFSSIGGANGGASHVGTLDFLNGSNFLANLNGTGISGGTVGTEGVRVADDGSVYGCNLSGASNSTFKIYKWPSDTDTVTAPSIVYLSTNQFFNPPSTNSFQWRIGDYMDLRGSGASTEIVVVGNGIASAGTITTNFVVFRPTDASCTNFTNFSITIPGSTLGVTTNFCGGGVTFEGTNNAIWIRRPGSPETRRVAYNPATLTATVTRTNAVDQTACQGLKYYSQNGVELLATVQANTVLNTVQIARVFQIPAAPTGPLVSVLTANIPLVTGSQNANGLGNVDAKNGYFIFGAPGNGLSFFRVDFISNSPPSVTLSSANPTVVAGFTNTFTAAATGSAPLSYLWFFGSNGTTNQIPGVTTNTYTIGPVQVTNSGSYFVIVTNPYGSVTSSPSAFTVLPAKFTGYATNLWSIAPGSRSYLNTSDAQRGLAYDAVSNRVVVVSRVPSNSVYLLDADSGADVGTLDVSLLLPPNTAPGFFPINLTGVGDDGAIYVANLITSPAADNFSIYRWASADTTVSPTQPYVGNPAVARLGDSMAVRGGGPDTQILCSFRTGTNLALFLPNDGIGLSFGFNLITVTNLPADAVANGFAGLGLAFGPGNTFWAKSSAFNLRLVAFDTNDFNAHVIATYTNLPSGEGVLGADNVNGYVATLGVTETPQNLSLWDVARGEPVAGQLDRELFGSNNPNLNGTGAIVFDPAHRRFFALDSNNGIIAASYSQYYLNIGPVAGGGIVTWPGTGDLQSSTNVLSGYTDIIGATTPYTNTASGQLYFRVRR